MNQAPAIHIQSLVKYYDSFQALRGVSLEVRPGDFVGFLGPNGAGKTTTINAITGLSNFQKGSVRVFDFDVRSEYRKTRPLIGLCPQEFNFDPFLTIEGVLITQAGYFGVPRSEARKKAGDLLRLFGLDSKKDLDFRKLSGGMKRRLLLCRALVHDPQILILDEPTAGADLELKYLIWNFLNDLNKKGKTIFLTTHYMEEAEKLSKTIAIIHEGSIVHHGPTKELVADATLEKRFLELTKSSDHDSQ